MNNAMRKQPVVTVTMLTTLASAIIAGLALLVDLPPDTEKVALGIITAAYPVVTAAWTWHKVYAPASVQKIKNEAFHEGAEAATPEPELRPKMRTRIPNGEGIARFTRPEP